MRALVTAGGAAFRAEERLPVCASVDPPEYSGFPVVRSLEPSERQSLAGIRPDYAPSDRVDRIVYQPGDQVQCDL